MNQQRRLKRNKVTVENPPVLDDGSQHEGSVEGEALSEQGGGMLSRAKPMRTEECSLDSVR